MDATGHGRICTKGAFNKSAGHGAIIAAGIFTGHWLLPVMLSGAPFYGGWLFWLCNNTRHIGLRDNAADFRLCTRTFRLSA